MKTTKQMAILAVIALFSTSAAPAASLNTTNMGVAMKKMLTNGPHQPPIMTPHVGGQPPACPSGGICG